MACVINLENEDSEMEEGEIVDDLSDISSGEEFLMRERLELLEMYNNVLERKKAKNPSFIPGIPKEERFPTSKGDVIVYRKALHDKNYKPQNKPSKKSIVEAYGPTKVKDHKKKSHRRKKLEVKIINESSEESDDEYRNKRRKLEDAVGYKGKHVDKSSLQDRLQRMLGNKHSHVHKTMNHSEELHTEAPEKAESIKSTSTDTMKCNAPNSPIDVDSESTETSKPSSLNVHLLVDLCSDDERGKDIFHIDESSQSQISAITVSTITVSTTESQDKKVTNESDDDLELLRQHALQSKAPKTTIEQNSIQESKSSNSQEHEQPEEQLEASNSEPKKATLSEDEDSDTAELRQICLKSAILKKAIEMKKKQKLRKRLSQSSIIQDHDSFDEYRELESRLNSDNNTDRESVDMDIGSDADEKTKEYSHSSNKIEGNRNIEPKVATENEAQKTILKEDELEEDEDLLRAKLLTSLSKNLPNLVDPNIIETIEKEEKIKENTPPVSKRKIPETRLVINVGESDSEGEHEATKNLTKMHAKLAEQVDTDFQTKLELLLKSKRSEVETSELPDVVQKNVPKVTEKYVAKTVNHLPRSEQMEYKHLVKRMAELQKIKEARQHAMNSVNQVLGKDTLKPRNVSVNQMMSPDKIEEQIALSRKKLAEESSTMLQLREEATKLLQKYKIVSTELKNISTAINLNKKEQRNSQNRLSKIRLEHNRLSSLSKQSISIGNLKTTNTLPLNKMQKENNPAKENYTYSDLLIPTNVNLTNDRLEETVIAPARLVVRVDTANNKKTIVTPNATEKQSVAKKATKEIQLENNDNVTNKKDITAKHSETIVTSNAIEKQNVAKRSAKEDRLENNDNVNDKRDITGKQSALDTGDENVVNPDSQPEKRVKSNCNPTSVNNEYESPLQALDSANWEADPNAIMCPFEVGGNCKDADCKYFHPQYPSDAK